MWQIKEELTDIIYESSRKSQLRKWEKGNIQRDTGSEHSRNNESKQSSYLRSPINFVINKSRKIVRKLQNTKGKENLKSTQKENRLTTKE